MKVQLPAAAGLAALLALYSSAFVVRFDQCAIVTTFGKAAEEGSIAPGGAGLRWKWPWPVQDVRVFDARLRLLEDQIEQQETLDRQVVIVRTFVTWRVADAGEFHRRFRTESRAEQVIRDRLRTARAEIARFSLSDLLGADGGAKLAEAEGAILARLRDGLDARSGGVEIAGAGIRRLVLPQDITVAVFERMRQTRRRMAQSSRSEGEAAAREIRARARSAADRIAAFAEREAQEIRAEGDAAAAAHYAAFARDEELAVFLRKLEALEAALGKETTLVVDPGTPPFDLLAPGAGGTDAK